MHSASFLRGMNLLKMPGHVSYADRNQLTCSMGKMLSFAEYGHDHAYPAFLRDCETFLSTHIDTSVSGPETQQQYWGEGFAS
jgi:hypothetical protein